MGAMGLRDTFSPTACPTQGTFLCQGHSVVLQEDDLQLAAHHGVVVHHLSHGVNELDDHFSHVVSWGSLAEKPQVSQEGWCQGR